MKRKSKNRNKNGLAFARIRWLFLWLAAFVFYFFYQSYLTLYLFVIVTCLPILSLLLMLYNSSRLYLDLSFTKQEITQNMRSEFIMKIQSENTPFGILKVDYQIENIFYESKKVYTNSLLCTSKQKVKKAITLPYCGCYSANITQVTLFDILGLWKKKCKCEGNRKLYVLPVYKEDTSLMKTISDGLEKETETWKKTGLMSNDSYEIRDYQEGDSLKYLHHKMSYKLDKPMVRQFASLQQAHMLMILDLQGDIDTVEQTLQTFYSIAKTMLKQGVIIKCGYMAKRHATIQEIMTPLMLQQVMKEILSYPRSQEKGNWHTQEDVVYQIYGVNCQKIEDKGVAYE